MNKQTMVPELGLSVQQVKGAIGYFFAVWLETPEGPELLASHGPFVSEERAEQKGDFLISEVFGVLRKHLDLADEVKKKAH